ncbi:MAG TPA: hypothetical protein VGX37_05170 [Allosphingosinicella sp.]|jgi:hypothetical protein|nr:hypothetical protein [Allosphingosinicella sp.]
MAVFQDGQEAVYEARADDESPFSETAFESGNGSGRSLAFSPWSETVSPFAETLGEDEEEEHENDRLLAETFEQLRDEGFDEAIALLAEETELAVAERFSDESAFSAVDRERFAEAHLSSVRYEAQQYLEALEAGLTGMDIQSLSSEQLDAVLDRFDPEAGELTPAGEEFIGKLVNKAKSAVKAVASVAKKVGQGVMKVAGGLLGPVLQKLKGLINPILQRVLTFAIGRLPAPLQPIARKLASRIKLEAEEEQEGSLGEERLSSAGAADFEAMGEALDASLAEAIVVGGGGGGEVESEYFEDREGDTGGRELEMLAEARGVLIDRLATAGEEENLGPAIEQFVPALLGALRIGINLVGRPKVVGFLAKYLAQLIGKWVGPDLSGPLSNAIVDTGLKMITLEAEGASQAQAEQAGSVAIASVIEDTVRGLAENEEFVLENEGLMEIAASEAFSQAVSTYFPPRFVKPALQQAPSLGGTFVTHRPRSVRPYRKYSRTPEIEVTPQVADALPSFGGTTLGASLRASGVPMPLRARMHIFQAAPGTTVRRTMHSDRGASKGGRAVPAAVHPLTRQAAGILLREPALGTHMPRRYLSTPRRIAVGQRFYVLEPIGAAPGLMPPASSAGRAAGGRHAPSAARTRIDLRRGRASVAIFISEAEAQAVVQAMRGGRGPASLLRALIAAYRGASPGAGAGARGVVGTLGEESEAFEDFSAGSPSRAAGLVRALRKRIRAWVLAALADWARSSGEAFVRAAAHPDSGVTVRVQLTAMPGLDLIRQALASGGGGRFAAALRALRGSPTITVSVVPGRSGG